MDAFKVPGMELELASVSYVISFNVHLEYNKTMRLQKLQ